RTAGSLVKSLVDQRVGATIVIPPFGDPPRDVPQAEQLRQKLREHAAAVREVRPAISAARAAVLTVSEALDRSEEADRDCRIAEERVADAEHVLEESTQRLRDAERQAQAAEAAFT